MAVTHNHAVGVGSHVTNDGKVFGDEADAHLTDGEHTHEDVWLVHNRMTDQDELWSFDPDVKVTAEEADEINAALDQVPEEEEETSPAEGDKTELTEQGKVVPQE